MNPVLVEMYRKRMSIKDLAKSISTPERIISPDRLRRILSGKLKSLVTDEEVAAIARGVGMRSDKVRAAIDAAAKARHVAAARAA